MEALGAIVRVQIQQSSLKVGAAPRRRYDPAPLLTVPALELTDGGVTGLTADGERLIDVHHRDHPESKRRAENPISLGFTGHYAAMRKRFGEHLAEGIAGENIIVAFDRRISLDDLASGVAVVTAGGETVELAPVVVATPCVEFSRYALRFPDDARPDRRVTEALQFLDNGLRGYYARYDGPAITIRPGDRVFLR
jgi:hypothetical protein